MAKGETQTPNPYELAAPVSRLVEVESVTLVESLVRYDHNAGDVHDVQSGFRLRAEVDTKAKRLCVLPRFRVNSRTPKGKVLPGFIIEAEFKLIYSIQSVDNLSKDNFDAFAGLNGIFNCWPYWREYVQQMTVRMGLPPLVMPVYRPDKPLLPRREDQPKKKSKGSSKKPAKR